MKNGTTMAAVLLAAALMVSTPAAACSSCGGMGDAAEGQDAMRHGGDMASGGGMMKGHTVTRAKGMKSLLRPGSATDEQLRKVAEHLKERLQLEDQQWREAKQFLERYIKKTQKERATLRRNRGRLLEMITAGETMDKEALLQLANETANASGRVMFFWAQTMHPMYQMLNETQREQLAKMRGHMMKKRMKMRDANS